MFMGGGGGVLGRREQGGGFETLESEGWGIVRAGGKGVELMFAGFGGCCAPGFGRSSTPPANLSESSQGHSCRQARCQECTGLGQRSRSVSMSLITVERAFGASREVLTSWLRKRVESFWKPRIPGPSA